MNYYHIPLPSNSLKIIPDSTYRDTHTFIHHVHNKCLSKKYTFILNKNMLLLWQPKKMNLNIVLHGTGY